VSALDPVVSLIIALGVALLFGAAALHKLKDWSRFRAALAGYGLVPASLNPAAALGLVALEGLTAATLPFTASRRVGAFLAAALLVSYALAIGINLLRGRTSIDCGCLGAGQRNRIGGWMVIRNLGLGAATLAATLPTTDRSLTSLDAVTIVGAVLALAALYATQDSLQRTAPAAAGSAPP
jgi:Methylamine utilisation protein MauE